MNVSRSCPVIQTEFIVHVIFLGHSDLGLYLPSGTPTKNAQILHTIVYTDITNDTENSLLFFLYIREFLT